MPLYRYRAMTSAGSILKGEMEALSEMAVIQKLRNDGHYPLSAKPARAPHRFWQLWPGFARYRRVSSTALALATRELSDLLLAGLELDRALQVMVKLGGAEALQRSFAAVQLRVRDGAMLGDALAQDVVFPKFYVGMVRAGEMSGTLPASMHNLADYLVRAAQTRETILSALVYPSVLLVASGLAVCFILGFVIPSFAPLFAESNQQLPFAASVAFGMSWLFRTFWWLALLLTAAAALGVRRALHEPAFRGRRDRFVLRIPILGRLWADIELERFERVLGMLLAGGMPLPAALSASQDVITNTEIVAVIRDSQIKLREGDSLTRRLSRSNLFPPSTLDLLRIGEETGRFEQMLARQADLDAERIRRQLDRLIALLVPGLTVVLGIVIAALIASMLTAILSINSLAFQ